MMRYIILIAILFLTISCKEKVVSNTLPNKSIVKINDNQDITKKTGLKFKKCESDIEAYSIFNGLIDLKNSSFKDSLSSQDLNSMSPDLFEYYFQFSKTKCVSVLYAKQDYKVYDLHYKNNISSDVYSSLMRLNRNKKYIDKNHYTDLHDFFNRGLIFMLSREKDRLLMISFNPFQSPELVKRNRAFFEKNSNKLEFDIIIQCTGIGAVEVLKG